VNTITKFILYFVVSIGWMFLLLATIANKFTISFIIAMIVAFLMVKND